MSTINISTLEAEAQRVFTELGYSKQNIYRMLHVVRNIIRLHQADNRKCLDNDVIVGYVEHQEIRYHKKLISRDAFLSYKNIASHLVQIYHTGTITRKQRKRSFDLPSDFERILADMCDNMEWSPTFRKQQNGQAGRFFRWLYSRGHNDLGRVDEKVVREYITDCSTKMVGSSLGVVQRAIKTLFVFVSDDGILPEGLSKLLHFRIPADKKMQPFMPQDEIAAVLNVIDRTTSKGKRDYAMILLATVTGLRGIDIMKLSFDSIDWRNGEIRIIQEKTDVALALPLTTDVGEAIREYILYARPDSKSDKVFLSAKAPYGSIGRAFNGILNRYCIKAGLPRRSPHSLRRGIATSMITSGVSVITVAQALGHKTIDSTKQYISLDTKNLKECALDFRGIQIQRGDTL